jgi:anti-anti-sigma regulatory factor
MKLSTTGTSHGTLITIETDEDLDLQAEDVFLHACRLATQHRLDVIEVNLGKTRNIRGSGVALLKMLCERTRPGRKLIRLVNCSPEIRHQLVTSSMGRQFQVV